MSKLPDEIPVLKKNDEPDVSSTSEKSKTDSIPDTPSDESPPDIVVGDYPDGGLRAWMVVCGVSVFYSS
jgi:hypothetical protein